MFPTRWIPGHQFGQTPSLAAEFTNLGVCTAVVQCLHLQGANINNDQGDFCNGLDRPEIESRWGARFSAPVQCKGHQTQGIVRHTICVRTPHLVFCPCLTALSSMFNETSSVLLSCKLLSPFEFLTNRDRQKLWLVGGKWKNCLFAPTNYCSLWAVGLGRVAELIWTACWLSQPLWQSVTVRSTADKGRTPDCNCWHVLQPVPRRRNESTWEEMLKQSNSFLKSWWQHLIRHTRNLLKPSGFFTYRQV